LRIFNVFKENSDLIKRGFSDSDRYNVTLQLGSAGSDYREAIYSQSFSGKGSPLSVERLKEFMSVSLEYLDHSIDKNRRPDGLFHSYNLVSFDDDSISVRTLYEMLEGQVAVLSSGYLNTKESFNVLDALRASKLYRTDQESYLLYPDRELPKFIEKNNIPHKNIISSQLLKQLLYNKNSSILTEDESGKYHFNGTFRNAAILSRALDNLDRKIYGELVQKEKETILKIYESIFDHQSFTGRSGTFYGYEGLGSIYWHMVSKLLLATQETYLAGEKTDADLNDLIGIRDHYNEIKNGLGLHKSPSLHGAFPVDAYSHTPSGAGAKQPGLTGQVKEDLI